MNTPIKNRREFLALARGFREQIRVVNGGGGAL